MSTIDPNMELMAGFIEENTLLLDTLDEIMIESEKSKDISEKNISEIFRIMHTIKGNSGMMGFESLANMAHSVEDVFFIFREDPSKLSIVQDVIFDLLFQASDFIKNEMDALQNGDSEHQDPAPLIAQIKEQVARMDGKAAAPASAPAAASAPADSPAAASDSSAAETDPTHSVDGYYHAQVFFEEESRMENLRAYMLLSQLKDWCDSLESVPNAPETDSSLSAQISSNGFFIRFKTSATWEDVIEVIRNAVEVKSGELISEAQYVAAGGTPLPKAATPEPPAPAPAAPAVEAPPVTASAPSPAPTPAAPTAAAPKAVKQNLISVNQIKLDHLMDLMGEIVTAESIVASNPDLKGLTLDNFNKSMRELRKLTDELQDVVMSIRMVPLSGTFQKMNRIIRDMCKKLDKDVELETFGGETEVDKTINDSLADPFMHMIRNSVDHAIETPEERRALGKPEAGKVTLSAQNIGGEIVITIADDGCGLDASKLMAKAKSQGLLTKPEAEYTEKEIFNFIMMAGFSTNTQVTEYSGRGVGMDVVRKNIEKVGGTITIDSKKNIGTTFTIKIPLTLAIIDGMEISVGGTIFTLPINSIERSIKITSEDQLIHNTDGTEMIMLYGQCYPLIRLHELYGIDTPVTDIYDGIVILIEYGEKECCIFADELIGEQQVVVKPFPQFLNKYDIKGYGLSGCTILGDGNISLIMDANSLLHLNER